MKSGEISVVSAYDGSLVDWGDWAFEDRPLAQKRALSKEQQLENELVGKSEGRVDEVYPELDTTVAGPWMNRWSPIVHRNRHPDVMD
mgnify:CR=1 FL=1